MVNNCLSQQIKRNNDINKNPKTVILKAITRNMKQLDTKLHVLLEKNKKTKQRGGVHDRHNDTLNGWRTERINYERKAGKHC